MTKNGISIKPQAKQLEFMYSKADEAFFGGSAGASKTWAILALAVTRRIKYPNTSCLILRRKFTELEGSTGLIPRSKDMLHGAAEWSERKRLWTFPNGSTIQFGHAEREDDVRNYDGAEFADIYIDELQSFTEWQMDYLRTRCRTPIVNGKPIPTIIRATGMPSGIGIAWVKRTFIDPAPNGGEWRVDLPGGHSITRAYIPATLDDNAYLGSDYERQLMAIPDERLRNALRYGRWDVFEGQFFSMFDNSRHVVRRTMDSYWHRFCGIDYGYTAPFSCIWLCQDDRLRLHVYRELYERGLLDGDAARKVVYLSQGENIQIYKADPSCWNKRSDTGLSISESWGKHGLYAVKASNERVPRWSILRSLLAKDIDGIPALTIDPSCVNLIRELREAVPDDRNPEDLNTDGSDHALDALSYAIADHRGVHVEAPKPPQDLISALMKAKYEGNMDIGDAIRRTEAWH